MPTQMTRWKYFYLFICLFFYFFIFLNQFFSREKLPFDGSGFCRVVLQAVRGTWNRCGDFLNISATNLAKK
jgi:hypothetical protein